MNGVSHPVWVRGLKHQTSCLYPTATMSHPVWVRGLKPFFQRVLQQTLKSHPVWVRGLKHSNPYHQIRTEKVAPRVGAWIETMSLGIE